MELHQHIRTKYLENNCWYTDRKLLLFVLRLNTKRMKRSVSSWCWRVGATWSATCTSSSSTHTCIWRRRTPGSAASLCGWNRYLYSIHLSFSNHLYAPKVSISPGCDFRTLKLDSYCTKIHNFSVVANKNPAKANSSMFCNQSFFYYYS